MTAGADAVNEVLVVPSMPVARVERGIIASLGPVINWISTSVHVPVVSTSQSALIDWPSLTTVVESGEVGVMAAKDGATRARSVKVETR